MLPLLTQNGEGNKSLDQWFSTKGDFVPQGTFGNVWGHSVVTTGEDVATGIQWVEARGATKYPTIHRPGPHHRDLFGPKCQQC